MDPIKDPPKKAKENPPKKRPATAPEAVLGDGKSQHEDYADDDATPPTPARSDFKD